LFTGCRSEGESLGFMSILDTELGEVFTLGDTQESIEAILGEPVQTREWSGSEYIHEYQNGLSVIYANKRAVLFAVETALDEERFEVLGYKIGMTNEQIADNFVFNEALSGSVGTAGSYHYQLYYDESGNMVDVNYVHMAVYITLWYGFLGDRISIRLLFANW